MSGSGFHVHGPHDHEIEHARAHSEHRDLFSARIAIATALLAVLAANFSYFGGSTQANAIIYKNNAAKSRTDAANQWSYYQSKNIRQDISVLIQSIGTEAQATEMADQIQRFENQKKEISEAARRLEEEAKQWDIKSAAELHTHHLWAQAATALQVAIAVAAVALVSRQRVLFYLVVVFAGLGCVLAALTFLPHHG